MKKMWIAAAHLLLALVVTVGLPTLQVRAQEEEEHPEELEQKEPTEEKEHPEQPTSPPAIEDVATFIENHIAAATKDSDGLMTVDDTKFGTSHKLRLDKIHRERLAQTAEKTYFVCADLKDPAGKVFDLDFWVHQGEHGLEITETMIHKEQDKPRYTWHENDGVWSRKDVE